MDEFGLAPGQIFPSEAAAARDIEEYRSAIDDHNSWWLTELAGDQLWVVGPYQAECGWTWDLVSPNIGFPPTVRLGPSGKPLIHIIKHSTRKAAKDAARNGGKRAPMHHPSPRRGNQHYHPVDAKGRKIPDGTHHEYPK